MSNCAPPWDISGAEWVPGGAWAELGFAPGPDNPFQFEVVTGVGVVDDDRRPWFRVVARAEVEGAPIALALDSRDPRRIQRLAE